MINQFLQRFGVKVVRFRDNSLRCKTNIARENLDLMGVILTRHNCVWWVSHGTLLGIVREGGFISHDTDIDISLLFHEGFKDAFQEIADTFELVKVFGFKENSLELTFERNGVRIDLFFVYSDDGRLRHSAFADFTAWTYFRYDYYFSLVEPIDCQFLGLKVKSPKDEEKYLIEFYGADWRAPKKSWLHYKDALNVRPSGIRYLKHKAEAEFFDWVGFKL